jgi:hypothetical protein
MCIFDPPSVGCTTNPIAELRRVLVGYPWPIEGNRYLKESGPVVGAYGGLRALELKQHCNYSCSCLVGFFRLNDVRVGYMVCAQRAQPTW